MKTTLIKHLIFKQNKMKEEKKIILNTQQVIERLAEKYPSPMYGFITQVRNGTGYSASRTADAMAMSLWPSRGLHLMGFEVKISRSDWLHEFKNPSKADEIANYCHEWYLVVGDEDIVKDDELPKTWGLIVPSGKGLKIKKEATFNKKPWTIDYLFLAGIFRNIAEQCIAKETLKTKFQDEFKRGQDSAGYELKSLTEEKKKLSDIITAFETASGLVMETWRPEENKAIGEAVKMVLEGRDREGKKRLNKLLERTKNLVKFMEGEKISEWES